MVCTDTCILVCTDTCILVNVALNNYNPDFLMDNIEFLKTNNFDIFISLIPKNYLFCVI